MALADLVLRKAYHKPEDDIASNFYLPSFAQSARYDRAVGFFSSTIYLIAWPSLRQFVANQGRMRLICSPVLNADDHEAMREGYSARLEQECAEGMRTQFQSMLTSPSLGKPAKVLASLIALGIVDCRIAWVGSNAKGRSRRLFHDKVGIFADKTGNRVVFKGSMNETWPGLALDGNLESVDVFVSWLGGRELERINDEEDYFRRLWDNNFPDVETRLIPDVALSEIVKAADAKNWPELVDEIASDLARAKAWASGADRGSRIPRPHQLAALEAWKARGRRGILEHATGSGKTFTALCAIADGFERHEVPIVIVPSELLLRQWESEFRTMFNGANIQILLCGAGNTTWWSEARLRIWSRKPQIGQPPRVILSTMQTASGDNFLHLLDQGHHLFFVADEVHRLGAQEAQRLLEIKTGPRLGLSATPERVGDPSGTLAIMAYFEGIVPPPFTLEDAISADALTPYAYHVRSIELTPDEQHRWDQESAEIRRLAARIKNAEISDRRAAEERMKLLLIRRSRIVKSAEAKIQAAAEVLRENYQVGQRWIVYCDDQIQLGRVRRALGETGLNPVYEYHSAMIGDPGATLRTFTELGGVVVSIKCLDEGVDIPSVSHALILASSKNPREYTQRRGRVLRKADGKSLAHIYDVVVAPKFDPDREGDVPILEGELARAITFGRNAINPACVADLERLAIRHGLECAHFAAQGYEIDDEDG
jgi:superfamily II DNA or RNA helicase